MPSYKIAEFLVHILNCLTINEFTIRNSFLFVKEIVEQDNSLYMGNFDVNSLFINIPLEETISICTTSIYNQNDTADDLSRPEFKKLLYLAPKEHYFIFKESLHKQIDGVAVGLPLGPALSDAFLCFYEKMWLEQCPDELNPVYYRRYVIDILHYVNLSIISRFQVSRLFKYISS